MNVDEKKREELKREAKEVSLKAYAPYSNFRVGVALLCKDGEVVHGVNVENRSFGLSICAERSALCSALSQNQKEGVALALYCLDATELTPPCGACRQFIGEFVPKDFPIFIGSPQGDMVCSLEDLLPFDSLHDLKDH